MERTTRFLGLLLMTGCLGSLVASDLASARTDLIYSTKSPVDRDGDGKPDLWLEFYPGGQLKTFKSSTLANGKPDFEVQYSRDGTVVSRKYDLSGAGRTEIEVTYEPFHGVRSELTTTFNAQSRPAKKVRLWRTREGFYKRHVDIGLDNGHAPLVYETVVDESALASPIDFAPCKPGTAPVLKTEELDQLIHLLSDRIQVDASCEGFRVAAGAKTKFNVASLRARAADAFRQGLQCLRTRGPAGRRLADEALAQVFSAAKRPLRIDCNPKNLFKKCPGAAPEAAACGKASGFDEAEYPKISLVSDCGRNEEQLNGVLFHELLHLTGSVGHQNLHVYNDVNATEFIEPCAQCCHGTFNSSARGTQRRADYCGLCSDLPSPYPVGHNLKYGILAQMSGDDRVAAAELEKALVIDPDHLDGWSALLFSYQRLYDSEDSPKQKQAYLYRLLVANNEVTRLLSDTRDARTEAVPGFLDKDFVSINSKLATTVLHDAILEAAPPTVIRGMNPRLASAYVQYRATQTRLRMVLGVCAAMSKGTGPSGSPEEGHARTCYSQATRLGDDLAAEVDCMDRIRQEIGDSATEGGATVSKGSIDNFRNFVVQSRTGINCLLSGIALAECPALRPPAAAVKNSGCAPGNPLSP